MNLDYLMELVNAKCNDDARRAGVMTLGGLRSTLALLPPEMPVATDRSGSIGGACSYRGYYERLALEPTNGSATAADVIAILDAADGATYEGYKGGSYRMDSSTFLHVAGYGDCGPYVASLRVESDRAVIETAEEQW